MNRFIAAILAPLLDVVVFCVLFGHGTSLKSSHIASFCAAMALNFLLKVRSTRVAAQASGAWRSALQLLVVSGMALFLRGGVLALLCLTWGWVAQVAIVLTVLAGMAVTAPGYSLVLSSAQGVARMRAWAVGLIIYSVALRLVYLGSVELLPEETYYWNYSRHLDIGYLDHPPMVAWLIRLSTLLFGQSQFGVRASALCCGIVTSVFTYRLTRNLFGEASALAAVVLAQVLPYFFCSGFLMTPDAPLSAAWAASVFYLERALVAGRPAAWWRAGTALGIGMISKYSIALLLPAAAAYLAWDPEARRWWRRWQPYAAALLAAAIFSPVVIWNAQHDWASFAFQTSRRLAEAPRFALHKLLASALILLTPTGVLAIAAALTGKKPPLAEEHGGAARRWRFIALAVLVPVAVFVAFSLRHEVKLDWTGAPWVAALPLIAAGMVAGATALSGFKTALRAAWAPTLVSMLLIYGAGLHYLALGLPDVGYGKHIELVPLGWPDLTRAVMQRAAQLHGPAGDDAVLVGMDRYAIASELAFYGYEQSHSAVETSSSHLFGGVGLMYERWTPPQSLQGRTLLLVAWSAAELTGSEIETHAERFGPVEDQVLMLNGQLVRHYYQRVAYNYRATGHSGDPR
jgi:dolichol-phosphate mannosyltransferase